MITLDTLKLKLDEDSIREFRNSYTYFKCDELDKKIDEDSGELIPEIVRYEMRPQYRPFGVKSLTVSQKKDEDKQVIIELSSKALKENYYDLINLNTVDHLIENVNSNVFSIHPECFVKADVLKADVTQNIKDLSHPVKAYVDTLTSYQINSKYLVRPYIENGNNGIVFTRDVKTPNLRTRQIFYDKYLDISKDKDIQAFILPEMFSGVLRVEANLRHFKQLRDHLGLESLSLLDVLISDKKVNLNVLNDITQGYQLELFNDEYYKDLKLYQLEKEKGRENIIRELGFNTKLIRKFLRSKVKGKINRYFNEYRETARRIQERENKTVDDKLVNELRLRLAA